MSRITSSPGRPAELTDVRADFPLLGRKIDGRRIVYLDSAATSQKPQAVIAAVDDYYRNRNANIHRSVYPLAAEATELYEGARARVADFVGSTPEETVFTRNATEAVNLVAYSWGRANIGPEDTVVISEMEHHSNIVPWQLLCLERGAKLDYIPVSPVGTIEREELDRHIVPGVKLVAVTHVSNVLGTINPVSEIVARAHAVGAAALIDGAQAVPQMPVDIRASGADFYVFTGHKMLGPTGVGVLCGKRRILEDMPPFLSGGDMVKKVTFDRSTWNDVPYKFEAGTSPIAQVVGLGAAVDYLEELGMDTIRAHERSLIEYALAHLADIDGVRIYGPLESEARGGLVSFSVDGIHSHDTAELLSRDGLCVRAGHHCAQPLMEKLGVPATTRASFSVYNDRDDVDALAASIRRAQSVFDLGPASSV